MTDLQKDLVALFDTTATDADVPALPLQEVLTRGRSLQRVRRRRAAIWSAAAAAVAVVAVSLPLALAGHGRDDRPAPAHHSQVPTLDGVPTTPTTLPYATGTELHVGARTVALTGRPSAFISRGDTTLYWDSLKTERWWRLRGTEFEPFGLPRASDRQKPWTGTYGVDVSHDGRTIAVMTHPTEQTSRITEYAAMTDKELGHVDLDLPFANWTGGGDSVQISAVNDNGRVYWDQPFDRDSWWTWEPGTVAPHRLDVQLGFDGSNYPPEGAVTEDGRIVTVADDGTTRPVSGVPGDLDLSSTAIWSPSGAIVAAQIQGQPVIRDLGGSKTVTPEIPGLVERWFGFESDAYVIGAATLDGGEHSLVRCAVDTGRCAAIMPLPKSSVDWKWATSPPTGEIAANDASSASATPSVHGGSVQMLGTDADGRVRWVEALVR